MKLATWNVNSIRSRLERLLDWVKKHTPDVLCLQELKCIEDQFPFDAIQEAGYHAAVFGQKAYNGVAILARSEPLDVQRGLGGDLDDPQARMISAEIDGVRIISTYVPSGSVVGSEKYAYKLDWMSRLREMLDRDFDPDQPLVLCGDLNVAVDDKDVENPDAWADSVLCVPPVREALEEIRQWGLVDVFRRVNPDGGIYSWWDYRRLGFQRNDGLRIDHIYATESLSTRCTVAEVDRQERKGQKPSDHAPVIAIFD